MSLCPTSSLIVHSILAIVVDVGRATWCNVDRCLIGTGLFSFFHSTLSFCRHTKEVNKPVVIRPCYPSGDGNGFSRVVICMCIGFFVSFDCFFRKRYFFFIF